MQVEIAIVSAKEVKALKMEVKGARVVAAIAGQVYGKIGLTSGEVTEATAPTVTLVILRRAVV